MPRYRVRRPPEPGSTRGALAVSDSLVAGWDALPRLELKPRHLIRHRVITAECRNPSAGTIDLLRTRVLNAMEQRGWRHLGITAPTWGCGVTFIAANLGMSFARQKHLRTLLLDTNLRDPGLASVLGARNPGPLLPALEEKEPLETRIRRVSDSFAVILNDTAVDSSAEVLKSSVTDRVLTRAFDALKPDVVLYDLAPVLAHDDVLSLRHRLDAVLLVIRGGRSTSPEVRELEGLLEGEIPILATVLNEAEDGRAARRDRR